MAIAKVNIPGTNSATTSPPWIGSYVTGAMLLPGGGKLDPTQFTDMGAVVATVAAGGAAIGATAVPVAALSRSIPSGTILDFTGAGRFALLTAPAATGATTLTVEALPQALVAGDTATYLPYPSRKLVASGTMIGRTIAERDANTGYGPWATGDTEEFLLAFDVDLGENGDNEAELYMHNQVVYENYLPNFASLSAATQARIRALYRSILAND